MKVVYPSRTGNVESIISKLGIEDALKIEDGSETVEEDYILFTYTDGFGDVPYEVEEFLQSQSEHLKGVVVSGDTGYGEAYCKAGDVIAEQYNVPCLYKVENDGSDEDIEAIKKEGYEIITPVIITNSDEFTDVETEVSGTVNQGDLLLNLR